MRCIKEIYILGLSLQIPKPLPLIYVLLLATSVSSNASTSYRIRRAVRDESFSNQVGVEHDFLGNDDDSHEHESCTSLSHPDIDVIHMNVTFLSTMVLTWVCSVEMIDLVGLQALIAQYVTHVELMARISIMFVL